MRQLSTTSSKPAWIGQGPPRRARRQRPLTPLEGRERSRSWKSRPFGGGPPSPLATWAGSATWSWCSWPHGPPHSYFTQRSALPGPNLWRCAPSGCAGSSLAVRFAEEPLRPLSTCWCLDAQWFISIRKPISARSGLFGQGAVAHVRHSPIPFCPHSAAAGSRCAAREPDCHRAASCNRSGTYLCMEGPAFSTRANSPSWADRLEGCSVIRHTNHSEAALARAKARWHLRHLSQMVQPTTTDWARRTRLRRPRWIWCSDNFAPTPPFGGCSEQDVAMAARK